MENLLKELVNNEKIGDTFFHLYERWQDESKYEDINEYGKTIALTIATEFPYDVKLIQTTKRPFGVKISTSKGVFQLWIKLKGHFASICGKKII
jgi:hypothetical protein